MTPQVPVDRLFDERSAANVLSCSVALMRKWRLFDEGPSYVKIGRLVRYRRSDIDAFLDSHRVTTGGER
jgi:predicted DNA-binding transcriptional regulator AlpA